MQFLNKSSKHLTENIVYSIHSSLIIKILTPDNNNSELIKTNKRSTFFRWSYDYICDGKQLSTLKIFFNKVHSGVHRSKIGYIFLAEYNLGVQSLKYVFF